MKGKVLLVQCHFQPAAKVSAIADQRAEGEGDAPHAAREGS